MDGDMSDDFFVTDKSIRGQCYWLRFCCDGVLVLPLGFRVRMELLRMDPPEEEVG